MTVNAAYIVAPVFTAPEVITFFFARVTGEARFGNRLWRLIFERDDLGRIAFFEVCLTWTMARFAACYFVFPTFDTGETSVRSMREDFELVLMTVLAGLAADVFIVRR